MNLIRDFNCIGRKYIRHRGQSPHSRSRAWQSNDSCYIAKDSRQIYESQIEIYNMDVSIK